MSITYRKAIPDDMPALKGIAARVIRTNYTAFLGIEMVDDFIESGLAEKEIDDGLDVCTVMANDNIIIGFVIVCDDLLHLLMVDTPYQNKGYGSLLLAEAEYHLFDAYEKIRLQTFKENINAVRFYKKKGWVITGSEPLTAMNKTMLFFSKSKGPF